MQPPLDPPCDPEGDRMADAYAELYKHLKKLRAAVEGGQKEKVVDLAEEVCVFLGRAEVDGAQEEAINILSNVISEQFRFFVSKTLRKCMLCVVKAIEEILEL